ncbi:uncharacterized protein LOC134531715 [Bacillus rossius redtenbacheri]|uniref:uncharacterized protein LOC134531715 n=1 Tax=Bacillus rossius redtenbacheri TaxID=93214 RepID=UPI002FDCEF15
MKLLQRCVYATAITFLILSVLFEEVDARRKILRGRKTITRTYYTAVHYYLRRIKRFFWPNEQETALEKRLQNELRLPGGTAIPAWAIIVIVGGCQLIVGGILYLIMRKMVLGGSSTAVGSYDTGDV